MHKNKNTTNIDFIYLRIYQLGYHIHITQTNTFPPKSNHYYNIKQTFFYKMHKLIKQFLSISYDFYQFLVYYFKANSQKGLKALEQFLSNLEMFAHESQQLRMLIRLFCRKDLEQALKQYVALKEQISMKLIRNKYCCLDNIKLHHQLFCPIIYDTYGKQSLRFLLQKLSDGKLGNQLTSTHQIFAVDLLNMILKSRFKIATKQHFQQKLISNIIQFTEKQKIKQKKYSKKLFYTLIPDFVQRQQDLKIKKSSNRMQSLKQSNVLTELQNTQSFDIIQNKSLKRQFTPQFL